MQPSSSWVLVALGSNLGDRDQSLRLALQRLAHRAAANFRRSSIWQTTPVDCPPGSPAFLNAAVAFHPAAADSPEALLDSLQALEREFGRVPKQLLNEPRPLDLDLIAWGQELRATPRLMLPHPRAHLRRFVLAPLNEVAADFILPGQTLPIAELLEHLPPDPNMQRLNG